MSLIKLSIERPIAIVAMVLMVLLFGYVALQRIPVQMAPDVRQPIIIVKTSWPGAAPQEVEREIVNPQEEVLKGLEGVKKMTSRALRNRGEITLEFGSGVNFDRALLLVANRLDRVSDNPEEADEPVLSTSGTEDNAIAWFVITKEEGNPRTMTSYGEFLVDVVKERIERVKGVAGVNIFGETKREMSINIKPESLARYGMTITEVLRRLRAANASITGGDVEEGKRRYVVRTEGDLNTTRLVEEVVLRSDRDGDGRGVGRVVLRDIAQVSIGYKKAQARLRLLNEPALAFNITREQGANVIKTMAEVRRVIKQLTAGPVKRQGLSLEQVYDETDYINASINLVQTNIIYGGVLAVIILMIFLRSWRPTAVVAMSIPVSVVGSFVAMAILGRSLNVISLAGIAFAVGMVVDAAIVVLENIFRLRQEGKSRAEAAYYGAQQVWPAVLVSALTTVMVFIPILIMDLEVGQLFRDIAVAISVSVMLSLLVAVTLIPALSNGLLAGVKSENTALRIAPLDAFASWFTRFWSRYAQFVAHRKFFAVVLVMMIVIVAGAISILIMPKLDYLPKGNRNLVFGIVMPPAGYNLDTNEGIARNVANATKKHWTRGKYAEINKPEDKKIDRFFYVARLGQMFMAATHVDPRRAGELEAIIEGPARAEPGVFAFMFQPSLFGRSIGSGRAIDIEIAGPNLETIYNVGREVFFAARMVLPPNQGNRVRPKPALTLGEPEVRITPDRVRLSDNGLTARELGESIDAFNDGVRVSQVTVDGKRIDLMIKGTNLEQQSTQGIRSLPVVTSDGRIVPVGNLAKVQETTGPTEIQRIDRSRTMTVSVVPNTSIPLEAAAELLEEKVLGPMREKGLPEGVRFRIGGSADKLQATWNHMQLDLLLALIIVFLVMAVLFESFLYPWVVMLTVPVAAAGGLGGLALLNTYVPQSLDMLTMLGFVILIGIVVNNAILLVHQTLFHIRGDGMEVNLAIETATRNRIRPIFMSTLTSVFGMLPLVAFPGAGSELYRGLGSVVLGGLSLSAVLTMAIVPPMMSITVGVVERRKQRKARGAVQVAR
ncbi:MAG: Efflux pump membrane transporter BepE [Alphaproteobacteria bacterium MarineAlpha11_Bin1]|nr:MAG: Efflux pump membrane transporter BepE [Alphaproteobacteria bacterium MarineAlpha11_Bin1]|tara:strand:- start:6900 stop:10079 length:3180 start_codon:yes stop_codon:yes gene_type:complete